MTQEENKEEKKESAPEENSEQLKQNLEKSEQQKNEYLAGWKRERADFLNYKREEMERIEELIKYGNEELILKILPVMDSVYNAEKNIPDDISQNQWIKGFLQIKSQIQNFLKNQGVEEIKSLGEKFDPRYHEVIEEILTKEKESGIIVEEAQKGYLLKGKVLQSAKVKVAK